MNRLLGVFLVALFLLTVQNSRAQSFRWDVDLVSRSIAYNSYGGDGASSLAVDRFGNFVVLGGYSNSVTIDSTVLQTLGSSASYLARYDKLGNPLWVLGIDAPTANTNNDLGSVALDSLGNIYFLVRYFGSVVINRIAYNSTTFGGNVLGKCDSNGNVLWVRNFQTTDSYMYNTAFLATDSLSNCYSLITFGGASPFDSTVVAPPSHSENALFKIDRYGNVRYVRYLSLDDTIVPYALCASKPGEVYVTGGLAPANIVLFGKTISNDTHNQIPFVMRFDTAGTLQVAKSFDSPKASEGVFVSFDASKHIFVTGFFSDSLHVGGALVLPSPNATFSCFLLKLDASGNTIWAETMGDSAHWGTTGIITYGSYPFIANNDAGEVYFAESYAGTQHFGSFTVTSNGLNDIAIVKFSPAGNPLWALTCGGSNEDDLTGLGIDRYGDTYFVGTYHVSTQVAGGTLNSPSGEAAGFAAKITEPVVLTRSPSGTIYCAGDTVLVNYSSTGVLRSGNQFVAKLSDSVGIFDSLQTLTIGKLLSSSDSGAIPCVIPSSSHFGKGYKIRVDATQPSLNGLEIGPYFTIAPKPTATITARKPATFCQGEQTDLEANGGQYYRWSLSTDNTFSDTDQTLITSKAGTYYVAVTDSNGCDAQDSIAVKVLPLPTAVLSPANDTSFCEGGSLKLTASGGKSYLWSDNEKTASITVTTSGSYDVTVTNDSGCSAISNPITVIVNPLPPTPTITEQNLTLTSSSDSNNQWYYYGKALTGDTSKILAITQNGDYSLVVHNRYGCTTSSNTLHITDGVALNTSLSTFNLSIAPNPLTGSTTLSYDLAIRSHISIDILNVLGVTVKSVVNESEDAGHHSQSVTLDEEVPSGTYFVRCLNNGVVLTKRLVLLR